MIISWILLGLFFVLLPFAPVYVEFAMPETNWELCLARMFLYRAVISVWRCRTGHLDFYANFTNPFSWHQNENDE